MSVLSGTEPVEVFRFFEEISQIPRGSYNTKAVSDYCVRFAKERNLEVIQDSWNNIIIKKPGTAGYEDSEPVIIQGHLDMVCEKTPESTHDFTKDPLQLFIEDGFVKAKDTTLGADNGIAVAMALAILDSTVIEHPPIEALFTVDEEVGMLGAAKIDMSLLKGKMLLNLDSEEEGNLIVGCAGGFRFTMNIPVSREVKEGAALNVKICGLKGGHSGVEIDRQRGNANKLAGRLLDQICRNHDAAVTEINGGTKDNVISFMNNFQIVVSEADRESVCEEIVRMKEIWKQEFGADEPELDVQIQEAGTGTYRAFSEEAAKKVIFFLVNCPDGVYEFNRSLKNMVETSDNLGVVETGEDYVKFMVLIRSSIGSKLDEMKNKFKNFAEYLDASYTIEGEYPGWEYKDVSRIRPIVVNAYEKVLGRKPEVLTIHAGLECGLLSGKNPELDCISYGPEMYDVHSFRERLDIASAGRIWELTKEVLRRCR